VRCHCMNSSRRDGITLHVMIMVGCVSHALICSAMHLRLVLSCQCDDGDDVDRYGFVIVF
jgi:hypothetical protein